MIGEEARLFLATGVMGGLTTYSAFSYETVRLFETGACVGRLAQRRAHHRRLPHPLHPRARDRPLLLAVR